MRHVPLLVFIVSLLTSNVSAQITSVKEYPPQFNKSKQIWQEAVENRNSRSIVAIETTFYCQSQIPNKESATFGGYDILGGSIFDDHNGIPPRGTTAILTADPSKCRGGIDGVIFENGQSEGDSRWVNERREFWSGLHEGIVQSLPPLAKVANQEAELVEVEGVLRHRMESLPDQPGNTNRFGEKSVYLQLKSLLRDARAGKTAPASTSNPQAHSEEVSQVEPRGIPRKQEQKVAIFLVGKLRAWKTALENGLGLPVQ